jgi:nitroimidazol reductase NimA-like FMN-containing flavoprotein (pyridoxamine 5'-phosphate oxidase superfamily)
MFGKLNPEEIEKLIHNQFVGRLGIHAHDVTYVVPVSYAYDGTYIYGRTFEGMKISMMRENPKVCFEVDDMKNLANWQSVITWGNFEELTGNMERAIGLHKLFDRVLPVISSDTMHITPQWPFPADNMNDIEGIVYRIKLGEKSGRYERSSDELFFVP